MQRRVQLESFTYSRGGAISLRLVLQAFDDEGDPLGEPANHRIPINPGDNLAAILDGFPLPGKFAMPAFADPEWKALKAVLKAVHTPDVVKVYQDALKARAEKSAAERAAAGLPE